MSGVTDCGDEVSSKPVALLDFGQTRAGVLFPFARPNEMREVGCAAKDCWRNIANS